MDSQLILSKKNKKIEKTRSKNVRQPGVEPGSTAWKAAMLTVIPLTPSY